MSRRQYEHILRLKPASYYDSSKLLDPWLHHCMLKSQFWSASEQRVVDFAKAIDLSPCIASFKQADPDRRLGSFSSKNDMVHEGISMVRVWASEVEGGALVCR